MGEIFTKILHGDFWGTLRKNSWLVVFRVKMMYIGGNVIHRAIFLNKEILIHYLRSYLQE